jgi:hypothetical protein
MESLRHRAQGAVAELSRAAVSAKIGRRAPPPPPAENTQAAIVLGKVLGAVTPVADTVVACASSQIRLLLRSLLRTANDPLL